MREFNRLHAVTLPRPSAVARRASHLPLRLAIAAALSNAALWPGVPALAASADTLGEIIVTARKREENLQDVPLSVNVYSKKDLENLAISQFEDYATLTPSMSFVSAGPGTQTLVMRGVSDGTNPNYPNVSATAFLVDDMSMSYFGTTPDLHFYDMERIEVLNGPQGTTYGAGAMAGAVRFITNKPDPKAFSAGVDTDVGKINAGGYNGTYEGYVNLPLVADRTALRLSAFDAYHGGFVSNLFNTRNWKNGVVSNNGAWSGHDYNVQNVTGARIALSQKISDGWQASLTYSYQRQLTKGAWDEDPARYGERNVVRFGPESKQYYTKSLDFHLDGDVGIADLVFASTYWSTPTRWVNEYSEYMQYVHTSSQTPANVQANNCLTDPISSGGANGFSGCNAPIQWYDYVNHVERWSNELRLQSKTGGRVHWLAGLYWEKTKDPYSNYYHMPGLQSSGDHWVNYYGAPPPPAPDDWYSYVSRADYLQTTEFANVSVDLGTKVSVEVGTVHFHSDFNTSTYGGYWWKAQSPSSYGGSSNKWNSKAGISYKPLDSLMLYANFAQGFRDGGVNGGLDPTCTTNGAPAKFQPDTLNSYELGWKSTLMQRRLVWNGAVYYMPWKNLQSLLYDPDICLASSFNANIGDARVYGAETNVEFKASEYLSLQAALSYTDARLQTNSFENASFTVSPGERLPFVPYFSYSWNVRYEQPFGQTLHGYAQLDMAHKGDMWNDLKAETANGFPRILQPSYQVLNLRAGVSPSDSHWLAELYVSNLTNKNAVIYSNTGNFDLRLTMNEPRVVGVRLNYRMGAKGP